MYVAVFRVLENRSPRRQVKRMTFRFPGMKQEIDMNCRLLILAALAPLAATAAETLQSRIDVQKLQEDLRVTDVIGANVMRGDKDSGDVEDVVIGANGRVEAVLVEGLDGAEDGGDDAQQQPVSMPQEKAGSGIGTQTEEGFTKIDWSKVTYDPQQDNVRLNVDAQGSAQAPDYSDMRASAEMPGSVQPAEASSDTFHASEIVGMEVHLSDAESFGEVEDVLIDRQQGEVSALLVDTWEGFDKQTYALPAELDGINREDNTLTYDYTESEVTALQEYEEK